MDFPKAFFYDEVREGFYINGMVKREWAAQMETLEEIDRACKKYGIKWFADCGTLLGAVRHGGYVPWDDDLDICMLRDDYQKFHKYAVADLPESYTVLTYENGDYWQMITRVTNRDKISYCEEDLEKYHQFPYTAGVDIFVLDYVAPDEKEEEVRRQLVNTVLQIGSFEGLEGDDPPEAGLEMIRMVEETCKVKLDRKHGLRKQLYQLAEKLSCLYSSEGAKEVVLMPYWCSDHNHKYPISYMNEVIQIPFEQTMINVPAGYDGALKVEYGDYLRICRKGGLHDYPLYEMQEEFLAENLEKGNPYRYVFRQEDLTVERDACPKSLKDTALEYCSIFHKVLDTIRNVSSGQEEMILSLLEQCQEGAITIGTRIEEQEGEGFITVSVIEEYCEALYQCGESLADGNGPDTEPIEKALERMEDSIRNQLKDKKEILFLPFRPDLWWTMEPFYQKELSDPDNHVVVMPLPFSDRDAYGNPAEMHYEIDGYPQDIKLMDYREYNIRSHHPDVIYTQNGYDKYNYTYLLPPAYFTTELKKYTEKLIYIPPFRIGSFDSGDQKLYKTTEYFIRIPGVVQADRVMLESEQMRELYLEVMTDFCGTDTGKIWEEKLTVSTDKEPVQEREDADEKWRRLLYTENGEKKTAVLFQNAVCSMHQYPEQFLTKLQEILQVFYENREKVALIWRPHPSVAESMDLFDRAFWLEYRRIVDQYRNAGWGILDEKKDPTQSIDLADAYYGDPDPVMQRCRNMGKPVMIANMEVVGNMERNR